MMCVLFSCSVVSKFFFFCDYKACSPPGSSVHGILQARIQEWVAFPSPGDLPDSGIEPECPALAGRFFFFFFFFTTEPPGYLTDTVLSTETFVHAFLLQSHAHAHQLCGRATLDGHGAPC